MLAFSVREAIRDAVAAFGLDRRTAPVSFDSPATPERVFFAIRRVRDAAPPSPQPAAVPQPARARS